MIDERTYYETSVKIPECLFLSWSGEEELRLWSVRSTKGRTLTRDEYLQALRDLADSIANVT